MKKFKVVLVAAVLGGALALPATSSAQTDVGTLCNSLLGSGTTVIGPAQIDRCLASNPPKCELNNTIELLGLVRIRFGVVGAVKCTAQNGAGVKGLVTLYLLP
jgi:hypothetical protein